MHIKEISHACAYGFLKFMEPPFDLAINLEGITQRWFIIERHHFFWRFETRFPPQSLIQHLKDSKPGLCG